MAVQAQHLLSYRALEDGSLLLDERGGCAPAVGAGIGNAVFSDLTCNGDDYGCVPRKRARAVAEAPCFLRNQQQRVARAPAVAQGLVPVGDVLRSTAVGSGAASTSGRMMGNAAGVSRGLLSQLYHQGLDQIDALVRVETERMRVGLEESWRRHVRALVAAAERSAAGRIREVETALELARCRNAEMEETLRQISAEGQAWVGIAKSHEAVATGLRATIDQILHSPCPVPAGEEGDAEDAQSCCFETPAGGADDAASKAPAACRACGEGEACVLLLPCRHLCLCGACDATVDKCPVCSATKNASLHVLLC